jgi:hypothetical protein
VNHSQWAKASTGKYLRQNVKRIVVIVPWTVFMVIYYAALISMEQKYWITLPLLLPLFVMLAFFLYRYSSQAVAEALVLATLKKLHRDITKRISTRETPTKTTLLATFESVRQNTRAFLAYSVAVLPMSDYLFEKLGQSIDLFFYAAGTVVLSEKPSYYSSSDERRDQFEKESWSEDAELEAQAQEAYQSEEDSLVGRIRYFGIFELRSFVEYFADRMFSKGISHPMWAMRYSINVIDLLNFFDHWNDLLSCSQNGSKVAQSAESEVKEFRSEIRRRGETRSERVWNLVVALLSAFVGFILGYLARLL